MYQQTTATKKIASLKKRIRGVAGGTSASKTISILLYLIDLAQSEKNLLISIVSESFPHLKRGAMRDWLDIMKSHEYFKEDQFNRSNYIYTYETGSQIEFFSADQPEKLRGARRDILFINEANNINYESYTELEVRTKQFVFLDWNPTHEFWWYTEVLPHNDVDFITLTYNDNESLNENMIKAIEARKHKRNWWRVYGLGLLGEVEGRIYTGWQIVDDVPSFPHEAKLYRYGLDFGFSNDPAAAVAVYKYDGGYILNEIFYEKQMSNKDISDVFLNLDRALIIADSAEPKSIAEIKSHGLTIIPSTKGKDSINHGIQYVQEQKISMTKSSTNLIKEYRNYLWQKDRQTNKFINKPEDSFNHLMDAVRYAIGNDKKVDWKPIDPGGVKPYLPGMLA